MTPSTFTPLHHWTLARAAAALGAEYDPSLGDRPFGTISTDTRTIGPGEFFLALRGEKMDGHRYAPQAAARGAAGLIVEHDFAAAGLPEGLPVLRVANTLTAYGDLAAAVRRAWGGPVLAISGSAGKTTTRRLVAAALGRQMPTLEPIRNFNNLIGVPQTLLRLEPTHEVAVLELGMNQPGELRRLAEIARPDAAILTNIGQAHIGMFASQAELTSAKLDLFRGCADGVPLVVNAGCAETVAHLAEFGDKHPLVGFSGWQAPLAGLEPAVRVIGLGILPDGGTRIDLQLPGTLLENLDLHVFGLMQVENVAAAAALLAAGGYDPAWVAEALPEFKSEPLRGQIAQAGEWTFILDCYNASPAAMAGALATLARMPLAPGRRRVLVLADMLELGEHSEGIHWGLSPLLGLMPDAPLYGLGPRMSALAEALAVAGHDARGYERREDLIAALEAELQPGDLVLFKGSHSFGLEEVALALAPNCLENEG